MNKHIVVGICGGIACYKTADFVRKLKEYGADVRVVMTQQAEKFVSALTFLALSGNPVHTQLLDPEAEAAMGHIELARWADLVVVAPATANTMAKLNAGIADDLLTTLCLATRAPIALAAAMNQAMWDNPINQRNTLQLVEMGYHLLGPGNGSQACGETGLGRMLEAIELRDAVVDLLSPVNQTLQMKKVLITTGPTQEALDPVRYISNHSSGKMGHAIALAAERAGAAVTVIAGPNQLKWPASITMINVLSADDMLDAVMQHAQQSDIFVAVAAVADYKVANIQAHKIKKDSGNMSILLERNPDILSAVAALSQQRPFCVGFAAETQQLEDYAQSKLQRKNLDMIAANLVGDKTQHNAFNSDYNALKIYSRDGSMTDIELAPKTQVATQLVKLIAEQI